MPVIKGVVVDGCPTLTWTFPMWSWAQRKDNPAQAYGEPYPSLGWIMERVHDLLGYRWTKQYRQADAVRRWLVDYGMEVQYGTDSVEVKY